MSQYDVEGVKEVSELFNTCRQLLHESYPDSELDFDRLNLTGRLSQGKWAHARGHFADVYRGDMNDGAAVAVKTLRLPSYRYSSHEIYRTTLLRFFREFNHWGQLRHINVVPLLGFTFVDGNISLISPWCQHGNMVQYLRAKPDANKQDLMMDVAEGTMYLHTRSRPLVHGDIKGANILVGDNGVARLTDFGISKQIDDMNRKTGFTTTSETRGTIPWMAPELLKEGAALSFPSDIYSCAGVFLEIYSRKTPYHYMTQPQLILAKDRGEIPQRDYYTEMAENDILWNIMTSCWEYNPQARPSIQEVVPALYEHLQLRPRISAGTARAPLPQYHGIIEDFIKLEEQYIQGFEAMDNKLWQTLRWVPNAAGDITIYNTKGLQGISEGLVDAAASWLQKDYSILVIRDTFIARSGVIIKEYSTFFGILLLARKQLSAGPATGTRHQTEMSLPSGSPEWEEVTVQLMKPLIDHLKTYSGVLHRLEARYEGYPGTQGTAPLRDAIQTYDRLSQEVQARTFLKIVDYQSVVDCSWSQTVPEQTLLAASHEEIKKQSLIFNFIQTEVKFVDALEVIEEHFFWALILTDPPIIPSQRPKKIVEDAFHSFAKILSHHRKLRDCLLHAQREQEQPFTETIRAVSRTVLGWGNDYVEYLKYLSLATAVLYEERSHNALLLKTLESLTANVPGALIDHTGSLFHPLSRLEEYNIFLHDARTCTQPGQSDISAALSSLEKVAEMARYNASFLDIQTNLREHPHNLELGVGDLMASDGPSTGWTLVFGGVLRYKPYGQQVAQEDEVRVLLFQQWLVITEQSTANGVHYLVKERPIPLKFLSLSDLDEPEEALFSTYQETTYSFSLSPDRQVDHPKIRYRFFASNATERNMWKDKITQAIEELQSEGGR